MHISISPKQWSTEAAPVNTKYQSFGMIYWTEYIILNYSGWQTKILCKQRKSWQRKFFAKKRMQRKQRKIFLEIPHFWEILPWKHNFLDIFLMKIIFFKNVINKMSVTKEYFLKNHKFHGICVTTLIRYYKMENNYVIFVIKIFFACFCKDFEIFFVSLQRMKMQRNHPL